MTYAAACTCGGAGCAVFVSTLDSRCTWRRAGAAGPAQPRPAEIGVGPRQGRRFAGFVDPERYVARFTEGLALMKALWTEPLVTFDGESGS